MAGNIILSIPLWPFLLYAALVVLLLSAILTLSYLLGQHHKDRATDEPYEGGIVQAGSARQRFSAQFYLVAMLFVIFDVEAVFIMLWLSGFMNWAGPVISASQFSLDNWLLSLFMNGESGPWTWDPMLQKY